MQVAVTLMNNCVHLHAKLSKRLIKPCLHHTYVKLLIMFSISFMLEINSIYHHASSYDNHLD